MRVRFFLAGDDLDLALVTARLGITPTGAHTKGSMSPPGSWTGRSHRYHTGVWRLDSPLPNSARLDEQVRSFLDQLGAHAAELQAFGRMGYRATFSCGLHLDNVLDRGSELSADTLQRIVTVGAELDFDIYTTHDDPTLLNLVTNWWWSPRWWWRRVLRQPPP